MTARPTILILAASLALAPALARAGPRRPARRRRGRRLLRRRRGQPPLARRPLQRRRLAVELRLQRRLELRLGLVVRLLDGRAPAPARGDRAADRRRRLLPRLPGYGGYYPGWGGGGYYPGYGWSYWWPYGSFGWYGGYYGGTTATLGLGRRRRRVYHYVEQRERVGARARRPRRGARLRGRLLRRDGGRLRRPLPAPQRLAGPPRDRAQARGLQDAPREGVRRARLDAEAALRLREGRGRDASRTSRRTSPRARRGASASRSDRWTESEARAEKDEATALGRAPRAERPPGGRVGLRGRRVPRHRPARPRRCSSRRAGTGSRSSGPATGPSSARSRSPRRADRPHGRAGAAECLASGRAPAAATSAALEGVDPRRSPARAGAPSAYGMPAAVGSGAAAEQLAEDAAGHGGGAVAAAVPQEDDDHELRVVGRRVGREPAERRAGAGLAGHRHLGIEGRARAALVDGGRRSPRRARRGASSAGSRHRSCGTKSCGAAHLGLQDHAAVDRRRDEHRELHRRGRDARRRGSRGGPPPPAGRTPARVPPSRR